MPALFGNIEQDVSRRGGGLGDIQGCFLGFGNVPCFYRPSDMATAAGAALVLVAAGGAALLYLANSRAAVEARRKRPEDADAVRAFRRRLLDGEHWIPAVEWAQRRGVALKPPLPAEEDCRDPIPRDELDLLRPARVINALAANLPRALTDTVFLSKARAQARANAVLDAIEPVDCLGGRSALEDIVARHKAWLDGLKWDEWTGMGRIVATERAFDWATQLSRIWSWFGDNSHLIVDEYGNDLVQLKPFLFICGAPRTGTSFLQTLLASAPESRSICLVEGMMPVPDSTPSHPFPRTSREQISTDPRLKQYWDTVKPVDRVVTPMYMQRIATLHHAVMEPSLPDEDVFLHHFLGAASLYHLPCAGSCDIVAQFLSDSDSYRAWAENAALVLKRFYQMLSLGFSPPAYWISKSPWHCLILPQLAKVFPEATFVSISRPAKESVPSLARLYEALGNGWLKPDSLLADRRALGRWAAFEGWVLRTANLAPPFASPELANRTVTLDYAELVADPIATVEKVHARAGLPPPSESHRQEMHSHLKERPQGKYGRHGHGVEEYRLDPDRDLSPVW
ncbi:P-loop containing nucleoside triphosphate hydrolase protein [Hyaloraphidium curvatum]|nr:P-loop containing nucleoside triphosphate hydrolase protein [Hyaloraphidium curvatum]